MECKEILIYDFLYCKYINILLKYIVKVFSLIGSVLLRISERILVFICVIIYLKGMYIVENYDI